MKVTPPILADIRVDFCRATGLTTGEPQPSDAAPRLSPLCGVKAAAGEADIGTWASAIKSAPPDIATAEGLGVHEEAHVAILATRVTIHQHAVLVVNPGGCVERWSVCHLVAFGLVLVTVQNGLVVFGHLPGGTDKAGYG